MLPHFLFFIIYAIYCRQMMRSESPVLMYIRHKKRILLVILGNRKLPKDIIFYLAIDNTIENLATSFFLLLCYVVWLIAQWRNFV